MFPDIGNVRNPAYWNDFHAHMFNLEGMPIALDHYIYFIVLSHGSKTFL